MIKSKLDKVEILSGYEGNAFSFTGDARKDILSITAVHPMRKDAVQQLLEKDKADWKVIDNLLQNEELIETGYGGNVYYLRSFKRFRRQEP
jgi:hypothetical protein